MQSNQRTSPSVVSQAGQALAAKQRGMHYQEQTQLKQELDQKSGSTCPKASASVRAQASTSQASAVPPSVGTPHPATPRDTMVEAAKHPASVLADQVPVFPPEDPNAELRELLLEEPPPQSLETCSETSSLTPWDGLREVSVSVPENNRIEIPERLSTDRVERHKDDEETPQGHEEAASASPLVADPKRDDLIKRLQHDPAGALEDALGDYREIHGVHPACNSLPFLSADDLRRLIEAIRENDYIEPVQIDADGQLIDGRSRILAAYHLRRRVPVVVTAEDPATIAIANIARRHLTKSQIAILALEQLPQVRQAASQRRKANLLRGTERSAPSQRLGREAVDLGKATEQVARRFGISATLLEQAEQLTPELREQVRVGNITVNAAIKRQTATPRQSPRGQTAQPNGTPGKTKVRLAFQSESLVVMKACHTDEAAVIIKTRDQKWDVQLPSHGSCHRHSERRLALQAAEKLLNRKAGSSPGGSPAKRDANP